MKTNNTTAKNAKQSRFYVCLANGANEVLQAQALRYQVFSQELGAQIKTTKPGYDIDRYDDYCYHLLVREANTHKIVGCTRLLTCEKAVQAGGFYSESEFDLHNILCKPGRAVEIGRTCVHADYRNGAVMTMLWGGLSRFMVNEGYDYLMGCVSVPMERGEDHPMFHELREKYAAAKELAVYPKIPLQKAVEKNKQPMNIPSLFKAYLRLGVRVCGEPYWDAQFKVADVFIFLDIAQLQQRYMRHFINRAQFEINNYHNVYPST